MAIEPPPKNIRELWFRLDKRLALIEASQVNHCQDHEDITKVLDDHEDRLRSGMTITGILTGSGGLLALVALIRSFFS